MDVSSLQECQEEWDELDKEFVELEIQHHQYHEKLDSMISAQTKCMTGLAHHRYRIKRIQDSMKKCQKGLTTEGTTMLKELREKIKERKESFQEMEEVLPHKNGVYLSIILGQVSVSLLNKAEKFTYKAEYERFKLAVTSIIMFLSLFLTFFDWYRWVDAVLHFLLVWYYCTLTIRENILRVNGSRIKGWWVIHHFISTVCAGIICIWPEGSNYRQHRTIFCIFSFYLSCLQIMQYYYQKGCLYRLRTLGERHNMDITVEGFMSWMWKGMTFLLPFLFIGYFFQLYNSYRLYLMAVASDNSEWQVTALSIIFFILATGNIWTTLAVIRQKINREKITLRKLYNKYRFNSHAKTL